MTDRPTDEEITELHLLCQAANSDTDYDVRRLGYAAREWLPRLLDLVTKEGGGWRAGAEAMREAFVKLTIPTDYKGEVDYNDLATAIRSLEIYITELEAEVARLKVEATKADAGQAPPSERGPRHE